MHVNVPYPIIVNVFLPGIALPRHLLILYYDFSIYLGILSQMYIGKITTWFQHETENAEIYTATILCIQAKTKYSFFAILSTSMIQTYGLGFEVCIIAYHYWYKHERKNCRSPLITRIMTDVPVYRSEQQPLQGNCPGLGLLQMERNI